MCVAIRYSRFEFSDKQLSQAGIDVSGEEVRVSFSQKNALLPVHHRGDNFLITWGCKEELRVPKTGYCRTESMQEGRWQWLSPRKAVIPASAALVNGVWFQVRQGIEAVLVKDINGTQHCYVLTKPSTHYFKVMTGAERMPVLINQIL